MEELLAQVEAAADVLMSPPCSVTPDKRKQAEQFLLDFRKTPNPFSLCRSFLEKSQHCYVLFETLSLLNEALLREWRQLTVEFIEQIRVFLTDYALSHLTMTHFVRERLVQVLAVLVKRCSVSESEGGQHADYLSTVIPLVIGPDKHTRILGCSMVMALFVEYSNTSGSSDVLLTWQQHFAAKNKFENTHLKSIFEACLQRLAVAEDTAGRDASEMELMENLLPICEAVLSWSFCSLNSSSPHPEVMFNSEHTSLRPGVAWKRLLLDPQVVALFIKLYWRFHENASSCGAVLNCLSQLCSLNGVVMSSSDVTVQYARQLVENVIVIVSDEHMRECQCLKVCVLVHRLLLFFPLPIISEIGDSLMLNFIEQLTRLTCRLTHNANSENSLQDSGGEMNDAYDKLLDCWACILLDPSLQAAREPYCQCCRLMFSSFLQCCLAPPDGHRVTSADANDEVQDVQENDRVMFKDRLTTVGIFGRMAIVYTLPLLNGLLDSQAAKLQNMLHSVHCMSVSSPSSSSSVSCTAASDHSSLQHAHHALVQLFEDVHWTILTAGHMLSVDSDGETATIPVQVNQLSQQHVGSGGDLSRDQQTAAVLQVTTAAVMHVLAGHGLCQWHAHVDPVVRLICSVVQLSNLLRSAVEQTSVALYISPELICTTLWFIECVTNTYIMPARRTNTSLSMSLQHVFAASSEIAPALVEYCMKLATDMLLCLAAEPDVASLCVSLLHSLCRSPTRGAVVVSCSSSLSTLLQLAVSPPHLTPAQCAARSTLTDSTRRGLLRALVSVSSRTDHQHSHVDHYLSRLLGQLQTAFTSLVGSEFFREKFQQDRVRLHVITLLESFIGVAQGGNNDNAEAVYAVLSVILRESVCLMRVYHNQRQLVELVLQLYNETAKQLLPCLNPSDSVRFYEACVSMIQEYGGRESVLRQTLSCARSHQRDQEDDAFSDLLTIFQLLSGVTNKQLFLLLDDRDSGDGGALTPADVCVHGLYVIMPLISGSLLQYPPLCLAYFQLIVELCEAAPNKLVEMPAPLLGGVLDSVRRGLCEWGGEVSGLSLQFVNLLTSHLVSTDCLDSHTDTVTAARHALAPFVSHVLCDVILSSSVSSDVVQAGNGAVFALICCFQREYGEVVRSIIQRQSSLSGDVVVGGDNNAGSGARAERLAQVFNKLTSQLQLILDRTNRLMFRQSFKTFLLELRGFMLVK